jgi:hypothetical protein
MNSLAAAVLAVPAWGATVEIAGRPATVTLTETGDFSFHLDNGSVAPMGTPQYDPTSNNYFDWINRFDAQLSWGDWHAEARFDSALFLNVPTVTGNIPTPGQCISNPFAGDCENLHLAGLLQNRYVNNFIPEKLTVDYSGEHLTASLGDSYLSYGRGLVISLLKLDALGVDTTLRGANVTGRYGGFSANVAAGLTNTVNTDPSTGEVVPDPMDRVLAARFEYRVPKLFTLGIDGAGFFQNPATAALSSYTPGDTNVKQISLGFPALGSITSQCVGSPCYLLPPASLTDTGNFSATLDLPHLGDIAKAYFELALQRQWVGAKPFDNSPTRGAAFYGSVAFLLGKATVSVEGRDYQNFFYPVASSISSRMFPAFWQQSVYNAPPILEEQFQEETSTETIYGPRVRASYDLREWIRPFASAAWFRDETNQYDIYDGSAGAEVFWQDRRSHAKVTIGLHDIVYNDLFTRPGSPYQQQWWGQFDVVQVLNDVYSLQLEGLHRRYFFDSLTGYPWSWGYAYLSLRRHEWSATLGYEYTTQFPAVWEKDNPNAGFAWSPNDRYTVRLFGGGREAGLRCINGICRVFPGFRGVSAEVVARY